MFNNSYDFSDEFDESEKDYEMYLSARAFLQERFGGTLGSRIYAALKEQADIAAQEHGGKPGLMFDSSGGVFAGIHVQDENEDTQSDGGNNDIWD